MRRLNARASPRRQVLRKPSAALLAHSPSPTRRVWLFDLDDTLHDTSAHLFARIDQAMTDYIAQALHISPVTANALRLRYWHEHGATLRGMMHHHGTDPHDFLHHTHHFPDFARLVVSNPRLHQLLRRLPGRKIVVSNGPQAYVEAVLRALKIRPLFSHVFGLEALKLRPKPDPRALRTVLARLRIPAHRCTLVEDNRHNLASAKRLGLSTIWVKPQGGKPAYVDHCLKLRELARIRRS